MPKSRKSTTQKRQYKSWYCDECIHWKWILVLSVVVGLLLTTILSLVPTYKKNYYPTAWQLSSIVATYRGKQPCADCPGIDTILTLNSDNTYVQKSAYLERNNTLEEKGTWLIVKNRSKDETVKVLQLTSVGGENKAYYLISDSQLVPLDSDRGPLPSPYNTPLVRQ